jgi:preprotein translocase subunit SecG
MLLGLVEALFIFIVAVLVVIVLIQKTSTSLGIGNMGGRNVMLFGSTGGQDLFQKITWVLGVLFMAGSLILSILKTQESRSSRYLSQVQTRQIQTAPAQQPAQK